MFVIMHLLRLFCHDVDNGNDCSLRYKNCLYHEIRPESDAALTFLQSGVFYLLHSLALRIRSLSNYPLQATAIARAIAIKFCHPYG